MNLRASAVFAADAVSRLSGRVGVAAVTAGPGVTNTVTAVKNAQMAESPLLLLGGAAATILQGRGALQDIDQMSLLKPICKHTATVKTVREIVPTIRKALQIAQSGTPGPVFVELPIDVLYPYSAIQNELGIKGDKKFSLVSWFMNSHLENLFAGAFENRDVSPLKVDIPMATSSQVSKVANLLQKSKKPLILVGSQATLPPTDADEVRQALESMGIPCYLGGMARGLLGKNSPIAFKQQRRDALKEADLVILAGAICDFRLSYGRVLNKKSTIVAVNRDKKQLFKNTDMFWKPTVPIISDVGSFIHQLGQKMRDYKVDSKWVEKLRQRENEKDEKNKIAAVKETKEHLNPLNLLMELDQTISDDAIMVADGGDFIGSAAYILRPRGPLKWLDPGAFGTLGVGGGFAIGAKLCRPESEVWLLYGDGSCGYSIAEVDTMTRHKLPVISLIGNDAGWTQIAREQVPMLNSSVACNLEYSDYDKVAEGYGGKGLVIGRQDKDRIKDILKEAQQIAQNGNCVTINALIGKTDFRQGSISV